MVGPRFDLALERGLTAFVGRQRALAFLRDAFDKTQRGRGNVLSVVGPAGIGKSRLAYELKRGLAEDAVTFLSGRCHQHGEALPFNLIAQLLQMNFMLDDGEAEKAYRSTRWRPACAGSIPRWSGPSPTSSTCWPCPPRSSTCRGSTRRSASSAWSRRCAPSHCAARSAVRSSC